MQLDRDSMEQIKDILKKALGNNGSIEIETEEHSSGKLGVGLESLHDLRYELSERMPHKAYDKFSMYALGFELAMGNVILALYFKDKELREKKYKDAINQLNEIVPKILAFLERAKDGIAEQLKHHDENCNDPKCPL